MRPGVGRRRHCSHLVRSFLAVAALFALWMVADDSAFAQDATDVQCRVTGRTDRQAVLDCEPGYATDHDRVLIYTQEAVDWGTLDDVVVSLPDLVKGSVLFDAGADGTPNLVIVFSRRDDGALVADIYDDRSGDGKVSAMVSSGSDVAVTEAGPVVQVISLDGWWQRDGRTSFNLDITTDGPLRASFGSYREQFLITDGTPEVIAHVRDVDRDGFPDYEWRQLYLPLGEGSGYVRTEVVVNTEDDEAPISGALLWPYLGDTHSERSQYGKGTYGRSTPPIDVDWAAGSVTHVAEFVGSRSQPGNYFIYSIARLLEGQVSTANFEAPFAFYDLSDGADRFPTLMIRDANYGAGDPFLLQGSLPHPIHDVSYVWRYPESRTDDAPIWDFKVNLVGTHEQTAVVQVGDLGIVTSDYATFPYWVTEKAWDMATFVADEGGRLANSEGIAAWGATLEHLAPASYLYMAGLSDDLPLEYFESIGEGYRGEVAPRFDIQPRLYISSLDGKLHLQHATSGIWNVDGEVELRYANLNGDAYIDQWQVLESGQLRRQLNHTEEYIVFSGDGRVVLKQVEVQPSKGEMLPPRNHEEWSKLREELDRHSLDVQPGDLASMEAQVDGPASSIQGGQVRDFRPDGNGFRFVLALSPGFRHDGTAGPDLEGLAAGDYVVTYQGTFSIQPLTPARVEVVPGSLDLSPSAPVALEPMSLGLELHNTGLVDVAGLKVQVRAGLAGAESQLVTEEVVRLPAGETFPLVFSWTPPSPGDWRLSFSWDAGEETAAAGGSGSTSVDLRVETASPLRASQVWRLSNVTRPLPIVALLVALGLFASALAVILARPTGHAR